MVHYTASGRLVGVFFVRSDGYGCIGEICRATSLGLTNGFRAAKSGDTWTINALPLLPSS